MYWQRWISKRWLLFVAPIVLIGALNTKADTERGGSIGGEFTLESIDGPFHLSNLKGKVVVLFFGFTSCPDVCPLSLAKIGACFSSLSAEELDNVRALFITLDPERDTAQIVQTYARYFHPNIIGLSGKRHEIEAVTSQYGIEFERHLAPDSALGYTISHPPAIYLVDTEGNFVSKMMDNDGAQILRRKILKLLAPRQ